MKIEEVVASFTVYQSIFIVLSTDKASSPKTILSGQTLTARLCRSAKNSRAFHWGKHGWCFNLV